MALGQKACKPVWVVLITDPALDEKDTDWDRYEKSLFSDEEALSFHKDMEPSKFLIRPPSYDQREVIDQHTGMAQVALAVRCCLLQIKNYPMEGGEFDGQSDFTPPRKATQHLGELITEKWMRMFNPNNGMFAGLWRALGVLNGARPFSSTPSPTQSEADGNSPTEANTD